MAEKDRIVPVFIREYQPDPHNPRSIVSLSDKLLEGLFFPQKPGHALYIDKACPGFCGFF